MFQCKGCGRHLDAKSGPVDSRDSRSLERKHKPPPKFTSKTYEPLPKKRGFIRLLNLRGSSPENPLVECELIITKFSKAEQDKTEQDKTEYIDQPYEALSWCWGHAKQNAYINIRKEGKVYAKYVSPELVAALKALRHPKQDRYLWIDAVCIDQKNDQEKNHQVEMMCDIYGRADRVCIWLGEGDASSRMALKFIKKEVLQLQNFDELCESEKASEKWGALLDLMQRPWFSRRWVVQEIALARKAIVYCGGDKISWKKFAVAVELFVEVETATHRLSEVMKKDPKFYHVPGWFEYVSALGASLLVEATGKLFRDYKPNGPMESVSDIQYESELESVSDVDIESDSNLESASESEFDSDLEPDPVFPSNSAISTPGQPLLSLEYLVSSLSIFEATVPHDTIYALLAIAKDTTPFAGEEETQLLLDHTQDVLEVFTQKKRYKVEYERPFVDVCRDFVQFCIEHSDQSRALDIICRPWAPENQKNVVKRNLPGQKKTKDVVDVLNTANHHQSTQKNSKDGAKKENRSEPASSRQKKAKDNMPLPSWIPQLSGAAYAMYSQAGVHELKMGRKNADTLVGLPPSNQSLQRNYNAAQTKVVDRKTLKFRKRSEMKHYSMYVKGFILDIVDEVQPSSQGGAIPREWAKAAGWRNAPESDPPDDFWRTLVADRGRDGRNPPVYYSRACKESFFKGGLSSGSVNTTDLINNERCSVVAQFCRRVQAVIWNRSLIKTTQTGRLGLASQNVQGGDFVCILYGCSVPVILRYKKKDEGEIDLEVAEDVRHWQYEIFTRYLKNYQRIKSFQAKRDTEKLKYAEWDKKMREEWRNDDEWRKMWQEKEAEHIRMEEEAAKTSLNSTQATAPEAGKVDTGNSSTIVPPQASHWKLNIENRPDQMLANQLIPGLEANTFLGVEVDSLPVLASSLLPEELEGNEGGRQMREREMREKEEERHKRKERKEYEEWKKAKREQAKLEKKTWDEPKLNWNEFELFLKYGRRWQRIVRMRIELARWFGEWRRKRERRTQIQARLVHDTGGPLNYNAFKAGQQTVKGVSKAGGSSKMTLIGKVQAGTNSQGPSNNHYIKGSEGDITPHPSAPPTSAPKRQISDAYVKQLFAKFKEKYIKKEYQDETPEEEKELEKGQKADEWKRVEEHNKRVDDNLCYFEFLGECYIHGMMDGEAMAYQNDENIRAQVFELR